MAQQGESESDSVRNDTVWHSAPLPEGDRNRDPLELWYLGHSDGAEAVDPLEDDLWFPTLLTVTRKDQAAPVWRAPADGAAHHRLSYPQTLDAVLTEHDLWHLFHMLAQGAAVGELVVFRTNAVTPEALMQATAQMLHPVLGEVTLATVRTGAGQAVVPGALGLKSVDLPPEVVVGVPSATEAGTDEIRPVYGVILDHAIGFANRCFCTLDAAGRLRTRFDRVWVQDAGQSGEGDAVTGRAFDAARINQELDRVAADPLRAESEIYARLGLGNSALTPRRGASGQGLRATHGTAVAQVAFGAEPQADGPDGPEGLLAVRLLGVQLPFASVLRTNGFLHDLYVKSALNWVWWFGLRQAMAGLGRPRFYVNHSFGDYAGRHDAFDVLDADFDWRLAQGELEGLTQAAGNSFQTATHAQMSAAQVNDPDYDTDLGLVVPSDGRASSFVQIWSEPVRRATGRFALDMEVVLPCGAVLRLPEEADRDPGGFGLGRYYEWGTGDAVMLRVYAQTLTPVHVTVDAAPPRRVLTLCIAPTADAWGQPTGVPAGLWGLRFRKARGAAAAQYGLWVERGDTPAGFPPLGRQAYLRHPAHARRDDRGRWPDNYPEAGPLRRYGSLSAAANSVGSVVVASHRGADGAVSVFSSASSEWLAQRPAPGGAAVFPRQPSVSAVSERSGARPHILVSGTQSHSVVRQRGTSLSAPYAMRLGLEAIVGGQIGAGGFKAYLEDLAARDDAAAGAEGADTLRLRVGFGRLSGVYGPGAGM